MPLKSFKFSLKLSRALEKRKFCLGLQAHSTNLVLLASVLRASEELFAWSPSPSCPRIVHWPCPTIRPPGDENNRRSSSIKWNTKEKAWNENSAGSAGALATVADGVVFIFVCDTFGGPIILPLLDRLFTLSGTNAWMSLDPSDGRKRLGHSFINSLSFYNYWIPQKLHSLHHRHIIIITTLFQYFRFWLKITIDSSSFVFQIINNKCSEFEGG